MCTFRMFFHRRARCCSYLIMETIGGSSSTADGFYRHSQMSLIRKLWQASGKLPSNTRMSMKMRRFKSRNLAENTCGEKSWHFSQVKRFKQTRGLIFEKRQRYAKNRLSYLPAINNAQGKKHPSWKSSVLLELKTLQTNRGLSFSNASPMTKHIVSQP